VVPVNVPRRRARAAPAIQRRRIKALLAALVLLWAAGAAVIRVWRGASGALTPSTAVTVVMTVQPGDSLWSLARRYGDPAAYILDRVDALARANHLAHNTSLIPGQKLRVPVQNPVEVAKLRPEVAVGTAVLRQ
jgi:nucleoid-associated protein YgaU